MIRPKTFARLGTTVQAALCALGLTAVSAMPGAASPLNFDFSFEAVDIGTNLVPGTVTGTIFGLTDNAVSAATKIEARGAALGATLLTFVPQPSFTNEFEVTNGEITGIDLDPVELVIGSFLYRIRLNLNSGEANFDEFDGTPFNSNLLGWGISESSNGVVYATGVPAATVPLPAGGLLALTGLIGLAGLRRVRAKTPT